MIEFFKVSKQIAKYYKKSKKERIISASKIIYLQRRYVYDSQTSSLFEYIARSRPIINKSPKEWQHHYKNTNLRTLSCISTMLLEHIYLTNYFVTILLNYTNKCYKLYMYNFPEFNHLHLRQNSCYTSLTAR